MPLSTKDMLRVVRSELPLEELQRLCPEEWQRLDAELVSLLQRDDPAQVKAFLEATHAAAADWQGRSAKKGHGANALRAAFPYIVRRKMAFLALERHLRTALAGTGPSAPAVERPRGAGPGLSRYNAWLVRRVMRLGSARVRPPSDLRLRLGWRLCTQRSRVVALIKDVGLYTLYPQGFVAALARELAGRRVLEIGAGDGTLARFLATAGVDIVATDDFSWTGRVTYGPNVEKLGAREALARHAPEVVLCAWPPPDNGFERWVFEAPSVVRYVVIGSAHGFATGNRGVYERASFAVQRAEGLARRLFPPEVEGEVLVFERNPAPGQSRPVGR